MERANTPMEKVGAAIGALIMVVLVVGFVWSSYGPPLGDYELRKGHAACAKKEQVVQLRGAKLFGELAAARMFAGSDCVLGPKPVDVTRLARRGRLVHQVELDGRSMYVDKEGLKKVQ